MPKETIITIIPAHPGWFVLHPGLVTEEPFDLRELEPILAWRIETDETLPTVKPTNRFETVYPITADGAQESGWVVTSNGNVTNGGQTFSCLDDAVAEIRREGEREA